MDVAKVASGTESVRRRWLTEKKLIPRPMVTPISTVGDTKAEATQLGHSQEELAQQAKVEVGDQQDQQLSEQMQTCIRPYGK